MRQILKTFLAASFLNLCLGMSLPGAVVRVEVTNRSDLGNTGYEQIVGKLHFEIDPALPGNAVIADVKLAPLNGSGKVSFSSDLRILKPKDSAKSNGAVWVEIPNRGGKAALGTWITKPGFTVLNVGWEFDLPPQPDKLRLEAPAARNPDGSAIRGVVSAVFTLDKPTDEYVITDLEVYPPVDIDGPDSRLIIRDRAANPGGSEVPRGEWTLNGNRLRLKGGLKLGKAYEISYVAEAPPVAGLGYAAIRDAVAWLRHAPDSPVAVKSVYAFGSSQCGRFLRDMLYLGFNTDEVGRPVFDGVISHIAGAGRLVLNQRWSTPRSQSGFYTASYPYADTAQKDPVSGHAEGILENARMKHTPKLFYINTAAEYWGAGRVAALTHTDPTGTKDISFPANVRSYFFASTQHGAASFPPTALVEGAPLANPVSSASATTALRMALHEWVTEAKEPPPSVHPKFSDGTLVPASEVKFPKVPGMGSPQALTAGNRLPNPLWPNGAGAGTALPLFVPQVDADGNDLGGIRMPDVAAPLGTGTGWVFRPASLGSPNELVMLRGAWIPFAKDKAVREAAQDPRLSLEERYSSKEAYLAKVKEASEQLVKQRFLTDEDVATQLKQAEQRWDWMFR